MTPTTKIPFYAKMALLSVALFAFIFVLVVGQHILIPILYALIIAILLNPVVNFLIRKKINKTVAILFSVIMAVVVVLAIVLIIASQMTMFSENYPALKSKFSQTNIDLINWAATKFNIDAVRINTWWDAVQSDAVHNIAIGEQLSEAGRIFFVCMLLPVYVFLILFYKPLLLEFIRKLFQAHQHTMVADILLNTKTIIQSYLTGLLFEMVIVATLNSVGLLILGIPYAIILGIIGAMLNIIPFYPNLYSL